MQASKVQEAIVKFEQALVLLEAATKDDPEQYTLFRDACIQRFECTCELALRALRLVLWYEGLVTNSPFATLKESFQQHMIHDEVAWITMVRDHNYISNIRVYEPDKADAFYGRIKMTYCLLFRKTLQILKELNEQRVHEEKDRELRLQTH